MSKVPFAEYKIGFEKFLKSESGTIYVQCKTFNEALYELQELMTSRNSTLYLIRLRIDFTIGIFIKKIRFSV